MARMASRGALAGPGRARWRRLRGDVHQRAPAHQGGFRGARVCAATVARATDYPAPLRDATSGWVAAIPHMLRGNSSKEWQDDARGGHCAADADWRRGNWGGDLLRGE